MSAAARPSRPDVAEGLGPPEVHWLCYALMVAGFVAVWATGRVGRSSLDAPEAHSHVHPPVLHRVNPNRAAWYELAELPGLGKTLAKRIVAYRADRRGAASDVSAIVFRVPEDLQAIRGIGAKRAAALAGAVVFSD